MGAYYTKEDITEYIAQNTIIPFLLDEARKGCAVAFAPEGSVWRLLRDDPDRYIHNSTMKWGSRSFVAARDRGGDCGCEKTNCARMVPHPKSSHFQARFGARSLTAISSIAGSKLD